ncbi:MAG: TonB-dependent receptor, partial [Bacteroidota bacterium]
VQFRNQLSENDGESLRINSNVSTDWQDLSLNAGAVQDYGLSISGGTEAGKYYLSANVFDQDGILVGSDFNRLNFRVNTEFNLGRLTITQSLGIAQSETQSNNWFGFDGATAPILREEAPENLGGFEAPNFSEFGFAGYNDYGLAVLEDNLVTRRNAVGNLNLGFKLTDALSVRLNLGADFLNTHDYLFTPTYFMSVDDATVNVNEVNDLRDFRSNFVQTQIEPTINYNADVGNNSRIDAVVGATNFVQKLSGTGVLGQGTPNDGIRVPDALEPLSALDILGRNNVSVLRSVFGRINYSLNSKYLFSATIRRDESSRFSEDFRVGYFPSASFGWRVSQEDFWNQ